MVRAEAGRNTGVHRQQARSGARPRCGCHRQKLRHGADGSLLATLAALYASGELRIHIDSVFSLPEASHAVARSMSGHVRGKVAVDVAA
ncbi:zinc-binding dehydrogenase [Paraburkholderia sp. 22099]|uniref:zinc-binding dehydrogenase n=1 Tax=Paraburkholderia TaxID=1822464 RepID=UPI00286AB9C5|nr:zinc-binding dehydrogenase [Paraburkholderia terricola]